VIRRRAASRRRAKAIGRAIAIALLAALAAAPAHAAEEGGLLYPVINFVLLLAVLIYFTRKPIQAFFGDRRTAIRKDLDDAASSKRRAEEHYAQWNRRIVDLERELAEIRAGAQERAEAERANLLADARAAADRIRSDAATAVEHELRRARAGLREEASQLAIELASGILRERITGQDRDRLIEEFIERIERPPERRTEERG
jgi:F-type H+-transporting ATPase subunit b